MKLKSLALLLMTIAMPAMAEQVSVNSKGISLILDVENGKPAQYLYFGSKLNAADLQNLTVATNGRMDAYPAPCVTAMVIFLLLSWLPVAM